MATLLALTCIGCAHRRSSLHGEDEQPPTFEKEPAPEDFSRRTVERQRGDWALVASSVAVVLVGGLAAAAGYATVGSNQQEPGGGLSGGSFVATAAALGGLCQMAGGLMMLAAGAIDGGVAEYRLRSAASTRAPSVWIAPTNERGTKGVSVRLTF